MATGTARIQKKTASRKALNIYYLRRFLGSHLIYGTLCAISHNTSLGQADFIQI